MLRLSVLLVLVLAVALSPFEQVFAASSEGFLNSNGARTRNNITQYDPNDDGTFISCGQGNVDLGDTSDHVLTAFRFFMSKGLTDYMAAGIIGNFQQESGKQLYSDIFQGGRRDPDGVPINTVGFGIAQWTFKERQQPLVDQAKEKGKKPTDFVTQLEYAWWEMENLFKNSVSGLKASKDVVEAAISFHGTFEKSADSATDVRRVRGGNATRELAKFRASQGADAPATPAPGTPATTISTTECQENGTSSGEYGASKDGKCSTEEIKIDGENSIDNDKVRPDARLVVQCVDGYFAGYVNPITYNGGAGDNHTVGKAVDLMVIGYDTRAGNQKGWALAKWLQSKQKELGIEYLIFDNKIWSIARNGEGWRNYGKGHLDDSASHRNHIHVEVYGTRGTWLA